MQRLSSKKLSKTKIDKLNQFFGCWVKRGQLKPSKGAACPTRVILSYSNRLGCPTKVCVICIWREGNLVTHGICFSRRSNMFCALSCLKHYAQTGFLQICCIFVMAFLGVLNFLFQPPSRSKKYTPSFALWLSKGLSYYTFPSPPLRCPLLSFYLSDRPCQEIRTGTMYSMYCTAFLSRKRGKVEKSAFRKQESRDLA